jgi:hypothetical protein
MTSGTREHARRLDVSFITPEVAAASVTARCADGDGAVHLVPEGELIRGELASPAGKARRWSA